MCELILWWAALQDAPTITITKGVEEGKKVLVAKVSLAGEPIEGAVVAFYARRTFGLLSLGKEETLDDGTAAVPFPEGLPGGATGELQIVAELVAPAKYASSRGEARVAGGWIVKPEADPFPRALWAPQAPLPLILAIGTLLCGVWCTYVFVITRLVKIWRGAST